MVSRPRAGASLPRTNMMLLPLTGIVVYIGPDTNSRIGTLASNVIRYIQESVSDHGKLGGSNLKGQMALERGFCGNFALR